MIWFQVVIEDESNLSGDSVADVSKLLISLTESNYVFISEIEGAMTQSLFSLSGRFCAPGLIVEAIKAAVQIDWGDFFMYKQLPKKAPSNTESYPESLLNCDLLLRCVDDTYFYIYTRNESLVERIKDNYTDGAIKKDILWNLEFPE